MAKVYKKFTLPDGFSVKTLVMRELTTKDEEAASVMADRTLDGSRRTNAIATFTSEQRECVRMSLVQVDGERVNGATPYMAMDDWSSRTYKLVQGLYSKLNDVTQDVVGNVEAGCETIDPGEFE